jgi:hypothetical protein
VSAIENAQRLRPPKSPEDLGVPYALVADLVLRRCLLEGKTNVTGLSQALAMNDAVIDKIVQELREKKEIEVLGMEGRDYILALTGLGQAHANDRMAQSRYAGACPVSLNFYREIVASQRLAVYANREMLKTAFSDLVIANFNLPSDRREDVLARLQEEILEEFR